MSMHSSALCFRLIYRYFPRAALGCITWWYTDNMLDQLSATGGIPTTCLFFAHAYSRQEALLRVGLAVLKAICV